MSMIAFGNADEQGSGMRCHTTLAKEHYAMASFGFLVSSAVDATVGNAWASSEDREAGSTIDGMACT